MIQEDAKLSCYIDIEDDTALIYVTLINSKLQSQILQFADITDILHDFLDIEEHYSLYYDESELMEDIEEAHLQRFMGLPIMNDRLDILSNLRMKMNHHHKLCGDSCILCNPELGTDAFPDFTFDVDMSDPDDDV